MTDFFEPGSANAYERQEIKDAGPPPGFVDNTVYVYRLDENGNKVLVRTEKAFPEPEKMENGNTKFNLKTTVEKLRQEKGVDTMAGKTKYDWVKIDPVIIRMYKAGVPLTEMSKKVNIPVGTIYGRLKKIKQAEKSTTVPAAKLEPAAEIIPEEEKTYKQMPEEFVVAPNNHQEIADAIVKLLDAKRSDYGTENIKKFGSFGVLVRVSDKVERLINLTFKDKEPNFESLEDTWMDIAGYAILALIELKREEQKW